MTATLRLNEKDLAQAVSLWVAQETGKVVTSIMIGCEEDDRTGSLSYFATALIKDSPAKK